MYHVAESLSAMYHQVGGHWGNCQPFNTLSAKFFRGNRNIYVHFMSFIYIDMTES